MNIQFATCERHRALEYIQRVYPDKAITDSPDSAGPLLDLVQADIVRVQDPTMHGSAIAVIGGTHWKDEHNDVVVAACKLFV